MTGALTVVADNASRPALIVNAGQPAARRFLKFFTVNIRNLNTRSAYGRAARDFLAWCEGRGLTELQPLHPTHRRQYRAAGPEAFRAHGQAAQCLAKLEFVS